MRPASLPFACILALALASLSCKSDAGDDDSESNAGDTESGDSTSDEVGESGTSGSETGTESTTGPACIPGEFGCECNNGVCLDGLECVDGLCELAATESTTTDTTDTEEPPPPTCGWEPGDDYYNCGFEGEDPSMTFPITCPDAEFVDGEPCPEGLTFEGCCDTTTLIYCEDGQTVVEDCTQ